MGDLNIKDYTSYEYVKRNHYGVAILNMGGLPHLHFLLVNYSDNVNSYLLLLDRGLVSQTFSHMEGGNFKGDIQNRVIELATEYYMSFQDSKLELEKIVKKEVWDLFINKKKRVFIQAYNNVTKHIEQTEARCFFMFDGFLDTDGKVKLIEDIKE